MECVSCPYSVLYKEGALPEKEKTITVDVMGEKKEMTPDEFREAIGLDPTQAMLVMGAVFMFAFLSPLVLGPWGFMAIPFAVVSIFVFVFFMIFRLKGVVGKI